MIMKWLAPHHYRLRNLEESEVYLREQIETDRAVANSNYRKIERLEKEIAVLKAELERLKAVIPASLPDPKQDAEPEAPAVPKASAVPKAHAAAEKPKTLREHLAYALRFQTDPGMTGYLNRILPELKDEDRSIAVDLLRLPADGIRSAIPTMLEKL